MFEMFWIVVFVTSIWVLVDAKTIGVEKGQIQGLGDLGPWGWFFASLLVWIIGFPFYLAKRSELKRINMGSQQPSASIAVTPNQRKNGIGIIGWIGIVVSASIVALLLFGQRDDGTTGMSRIATATAQNEAANFSLSDVKAQQGAYGVRTITGTVTNNTTKSYGYVQVEINLYDKSGAMVGSTLANANNLAPNGKWKFSAPVLAEGASTFKVEKVTGF